jgi:hypothetical protein
VVQVYCDDGTANHIGPEPCAGPILEPVSGQVALCFPGKVISGGRDIRAITSVETECEESRDQVDPAEGANTGVFGAAPPLNLCVR